MDNDAAVMQATPGNYVEIAHGEQRKAVITTRSMAPCPHRTSSHVPGSDQAQNN